MSELVWVSGAMADERLVLLVTADIVVNENVRTLEALKRMQSGESLEATYFPKQLWFDHKAKIPANLPHFFYANGYWIVSEKLAVVLREFDIGAANLHPVELLRQDRKTPVDGNFFSLNITGRKQSFLAADSPKTRAFLGPDRRVLAFVPGDGDVAVSRDALDGVDLWIEPNFFRAFFVSAKLGDALKSAELIRPLRLLKCKLL